MTARLIITLLLPAICLLKQFVMQNRTEGMEPLNPSALRPQKWVTIKWMAVRSGLTPPCSVITLRLVSFADHFLSRPLPLNIHVEDYWNRPVEAIKHRGREHSGDELQGRETWRLLNRVCVLVKNQICSSKDMNTAEEVLRFVHYTSWINPAETSGFNGQGFYLC